MWIRADELKRAKSNIANTPLSALLMEIISSNLNPEHAKPSNMVSFEDAQEALTSSDNRQVNALGYEVGGIEYAIRTFPGIIKGISREIATTQKIADVPILYNDTAVGIRQLRLNLAEQLEVLRQEMITDWATDANSFLRIYPGALTVAEKANHDYTPVTAFLHEDDHLFLHAESPSGARLYDISAGQESVHAVLDSTQLPTLAQQVITKYLTD